MDQTKKAVFSREETQLVKVEFIDQKIRINLVMRTKKKKHLTFNTKVQDYFSMNKKECGI